MTGKALFRFPALNAQQILKNVAERWDLSGLLPLPIWDMQCPVCWARMSENLIQPSSWAPRNKN